ncbi:uncharacterized protein O3C94_012835 isoform 2-T3 [Discoglossus pictus]
MEMYLLLLYVLIFVSGAKTQIPTTPDVPVTTHPGVSAKETPTTQVATKHVDIGTHVVDPATTKVSGAKTKIHTTPDVPVTTYPDVKTTVPVAGHAITPGVSAKETPTTQVATKHVVKTTATLRHVATKGVDPTDSLTTHVPKKGVEDNVTVAGHTTEDSLSKPLIRFLSLLLESVEISCFSESGSLPITYSIFNNKKNLLKKTLNSRIPAIFTIPLTGENSVEFMCQAENDQGVQSSKSEFLKTGETSTPKNEHKLEEETGPKYLIVLSRILTSLDPQTQRKNTIVLIVCFSSTACALVAFIFISLFCKRRMRRIRK